MFSIKHWQDNRDACNQRGIKLPKFDTSAVKEAGKKQPLWIHFGGGNLYRAFHAAVAQDIIDAGKMTRGVVVVETFSPFTIDEVYAPYANDILQVVMNSDSSIQQRILSSTSDALFANPQRLRDYEKIKQYFRNSDLQMCTFTITEKGYVIYDHEEEGAAGPEKTTSTMGIVTACLYERYLEQAAPIAMVSTDNFSRNGERFRQAVTSVASDWYKSGKVDQGFVTYVSDETQVSFPWTMIDRITPNPSKETAQLLLEEGINDAPLIDAGHGASFAVFSNTEQAHYLVVEDNFPNGRPQLELGGVIMCDRETAERADTMKVTACLNPLHTCLAVYGCLLGYTRIWQEMKNPDLVALISHIGYDEDLPVVLDPGVINPRKFIDELIEFRLPNKSLPDAPQRIACDTSQKMSIRFGHTIQSYVSAGKDPATLIYIPLAIAGWLRYLMGIDDTGTSFTLSPDPLLNRLCAQMAILHFGTSDSAMIHKAIEPILSDKSLFGVDLYSVGLGRKIESYLAELLAGPGAVAATIKRYI